MRILSLELERYGSFTDRTLEFNPAARLHVVYGRNATGKSCALAGITDLFFGIEAQTRYAFLHEGKTMRLGATLQARDLSSLAFKRRKGNKNVLSAPAGESLEDSVLHPFLGGLTRSVFSHAFGLNSEQLRAGAEEMLDSEGEVGATLYAAASGLSGITRLRRQLDEEASKIFKPGRGSDKRRFDQAAEAYSQARVEVRQRTLRADALEAMRANIESLTSHLASLNQIRGENRAEHARLTRLRTIAPQLRSLDAEREELEAFADLPDLSEQAIDRLKEAIEASEKSRLNRVSAIDALTRAKAALEEIAVAPATLHKTRRVSMCECTRAQPSAFLLLRLLLPFKGRRCGQDTGPQRWVAEDAHATADREENTPTSRHHWRNALSQFCVYSTDTIKWSVCQRPKETASLRSPGRATHGRY